MASWGGAAWTPELGQQCTGNPLRRTARLMLDQAGIIGDEDDVVTLLLERMARSYKDEGVPWMPGALRLIEALTAEGIPSALVSSSYRILLDPVLGSVPAGFFATSVAGDEVTHAKPAPDPYIEAATRLGADIATCVVVEDSQPGLRAGLDSGAAVVGLGAGEHPEWPTPHCAASAIGDVTIPLLAEAVARRASTAADQSPR